MDGRPGTPVRLSNSCCAQHSSAPNYVRAGKTTPPPRESGSLQLRCAIGTTWPSSRAGTRSGNCLIQLP